MCEVGGWGCPSVHTQARAHAYMMSRCWRRKSGAPSFHLHSDPRTQYFTNPGLGWQLPGPREALLLLSTAWRMPVNVAKLTWVPGPRFRPSCVHRRHSQALRYLPSSRCLNFILSINMFSNGEKTSIRKFLIHAPRCSSGTPMLVLLTPRCHLH